MPGKIIVKSAEFIASSESESESESGIPNVNVRSSAPQTSNRKRKHASPTSTSTKRAKTTPISSSRRKQSLSSGVSSESEDDSRSASKDDSGHSVDKNEGEPDRTVVDPMGSPNHIESPTLIVRTSPPPYEVPDGFECSVLNSQCSTTLEQLFTPSNLTGKQIWNITAPAGVPLSNIKEVAQAHVKKGDKILSFNGNDYSFVSGNLSDTIDMKLLVPTKNGTAYRTGMYTDW